MPLRSTVVLIVLCCYGSLPAQTAQIPVATYSIAGFDPETGEIGVAVQSKFPAVGNVVPWVKAGVGAIATQSFANTTYGPKGHQLLEEGKEPDEVIRLLTDADPASGRRQVGIVDATGRAATFTGDACLPWAGGKTGKHYAVQGNILLGEEVIDAMAKSFEESTGPLALRLIDALQAGQDAGGEHRGMQAAAVYVAREGWGYAGLNDRFRDLRVDDHPKPIEELKRIYEVHKKLFPRPQ